ncbi:MAG: hypothetical protein IJS09_06575 [Treponema sp.]|nr:hypothetical protein [Treponema sp.]
MKGVIVQIGKPKSIVLFNNGKICAIPTPLEAHVGMVVSVKLNNRAKVLAVTVAICLVLAAGSGIGIFVAHSTAKNRHQTENPQKTEQTEQNEQFQHDMSGYSFQKGKEENK